MRSQLAKCNQGGGINDTQNETPVGDAEDQDADEPGAAEGEASDEVIKEDAEDVQQDGIVVADAEEKEVVVKSSSKEEKAEDQVLTATAEDGAIITVSAPAGVLPAGSKVTANVVNLDSVRQTLEEAVASDGRKLTDYKVYDITITDADGNEIQPDGNVTVTIKGADIQGESVDVYHIEDDNAEKIADDVDGDSAEFIAEHFSLYSVAASGSYVAESVRVTVKKDTEGQEVKEIPSGKISENAPMIDGYDFVDARYANSTVAEIFVVNNGDGYLYYVSSTENALSAVEVENTTDIILNYRSHIDNYSVTYVVTVDGTNQEENLDSIVELIGVGNVDKGETFSFSANPQFGYNIKTVSAVIGEETKTLSGNSNGIYTINGNDVTANIVITVALEEVKEYNISFSGSNTTFDYNENTYVSEKDKVKTWRYSAENTSISFTLKPNMQNGGETKALNKLAITLKGEKGSEETIAVVAPIKDGDTSEREFSNGTKVKVTRIKTEKYSSSGWGWNKKETCGGGIFTVEITGPDGGKLRGDISVDTNYKRSDSSEIWPQDLVGVELYAESGSKEGPLDPTAFKYIDRDSKAISYIYIKVKDGYSKEKVKVVVTIDGVLYKNSELTLKESTKPGYDYYFTIKEDQGKWSPKDIRISVETEKVEKNFNVIYDYDNGTESFKDAKVYKLNSHFPVTDGKLEYPIKNGYVFQGWEIGGALYKPGSVYTVDESTESLAIKDSYGNYVYTFTAKWVKSDQADDALYHINIFFSDENGEYSVDPTVSFAEFGPADKTAYVISSQLKSLLKDREGELPEGWDTDYIEDSAKSEKSVLINKDGSSAAKIYYTKRAYKVTVTANSLETTYNGAEQKAEGFIGETEKGISVKVNGKTYYVKGLTSTISSTDVVEKKSGEITGTWSVVDADGKDVSHWFKEVKTEPGYLTINKRPLTITGYGWEEEQPYTGKAYNSSKYTIEETSESQGLVGEQRIENLSYSIEGTDAGSYTGTFNVDADNIVIKDSKGINVTNNYDINLVPGTLTIKKIDIHDYVTLTPENISVTYDGKSHAAGTATLSSTLLGGIVGLNVQYSRDGQDWKNSPSDITETNVTNGSVTVYVKVSGDNYEGELTAEQMITITKRPLIIVGEGWTSDQPYTGETYRQTDYNAEGTTETDKGLVSGHTLDKTSGCTYRIEGTDAGEYTGKFANESDVVIKDSTGANVASNYAITWKPGSLTITKADIANKVTLNTHDAEKVYDGKPLSAKEATVTVQGTGSASGLKIEYSLDENTWSENPLTITQTNYTENPVIVHVKVTGANYDGVVTGMQKIKVTQRPLTITGNGWDAEQSYTGEEYVASDYTVEECSENRGLVDGQTFVKGSLTYELKGTNAGRYTGTFGDKAAVVINDASDNNVAGNYAIDLKPGTLMITAAEIAANVQLNVKNVEKVYDGSPISTGTAVVKAIGTGSTEDLKVEYSLDGKVWRENPSEITWTEYTEEAVKVKVRVTGKNYKDSLQGEQTITIKQRPLSITGDGWNVDQPYTGKEYVTTDYTVEALSEDCGLAEGQEFDKESLTYILKGTNAGGPYVGKFTFTSQNAVVIKDKDGNDVTANYAVDLKPGTLTITTAEIANYVQLETQNVEEIYNGKPYTAGTATVKATGTDASVVDGLTIEYSFDRVDWKTAPSEITWTDYTKEPVIVYVRVTGSNYKESLEGTQTITIKQKQLTITGEGWDEEQLYNGSEYRKDGYDITELAEGQTLDRGSLTYEIKGTNANIGDSSYEGSFGENPEIWITADDSTKNLAYNYDITMKPGNLKIKKRNVILTSKSAEKPYDGTPLTNHDVDIMGDDFVDGEGVIITYTGTQTVVGESDNTFDYAWKEGTLESNYTIAPKYGKLEVTDLAEADKYEIQVTANSDTATYDGNPHSVSGFEGETENGIVVIASNDLTYYVTNLQSKATGTNVSDSVKAIAISGSAIVKDTEGNDVTNQFKLTTVPGSLTINKRNVYLESKPFSKIYDGIELKDNGSGLDREEGWLTGKEATYRFSGKQTLVGKSDNTFECVFNEGVDFNNYEIHYGYGILEVKDGTATDPIDPSKVVTKTHDRTSTDTDYALGDTITFTIKVTNIYNEVKDITVIEQDGVTITGDSKFENVEPGQEVTTTATYTVTEDDIQAGRFKNEVKVVFSGEKEFSNTDTVEEIEDVNSSIKLEKKVVNEAVKGGKYDYNETVEYSIIAENTGNVTLTNIKVEDTLTGDSWTIPSLAPGKKSNPLETSYTVNDMDILESSVVNTATATGSYEGSDDPVEASDTETVQTVTPFSHLTLIKTVTSKPANGSSYALGETITYEISAINDGNQRLTDVVVTDALTGDSWMIPKLTQHETTVVGTTSHTVTEADILNPEGKVTNVVTATAATPDPAGVIVEDGVKEDPVVRTEPGLSVIKTITSENEGGYGLGDEISYKIEVTNNGNLTVNNISVTDELTGDTWTVDTLNQNGKWSEETTYTVTEADILAGTVVNTAVASGTASNNASVTDSGSVAARTEAKDGSLILSKRTINEPANGESYVLDETIIYGITATNNGNLTLTDITITDELTGAEWTIDSLDPGAVSEEYRTTHVVTEADILAGSVVNEVTAAGTSSDPDETKPDVTPDKVEVRTEDPNGHLTLTKITTSTPANGTAYALGETITYQIIATNDGNLTLTDVVVTDELTGGRWTIAEIAPGQNSTVMETSYIVTEADILNGIVVNEATATGVSPDPKKPEPGVTPGGVTDDAEAKDGHLTLTKETTSTPANGSTYALGETITYEIRAINDGNLTLTNVEVEDALTGGRWVIEEIKPGQRSTAMTTSYVVTEADILAGSIANVATAAGESPDPEKPEVPVEPGEKEVPTSTAGASLFVEKTASASVDGGTYGLGETVTYTITVTNNGNVTVNNINVEDPLTGENWNIRSLAPNASQSFTTTYTVTEADIQRGQIVNTATASGTDPSGNPVTGDGSRTITSDPVNTNLTVDKTVIDPKSQYNIGDKIQYRIEVANRGNVALHNVRVTDIMSGTGRSVVFTDLGGGTLDNGVVVFAEIPVGETRTILCEYTVVRADAGAQPITNRADASSDEGRGDTPSDITPVTPVETAYTLTIHYTNTRGVTMAPDYVGQYVEGEQFHIVSPRISGYKANYSAIDSSANGMPARDLTYTVIYRRNNNNGGGSSSGGGGTDEPTPTPGPAPGENPTPAPGTNPPAGTTVPQAAETAEDTEAPVGVIVPNEEGGYDVVPVEDTDVPLAQLPSGEGTVADIIHECCALHFIIMLICMLILALYTWDSKKLQASIFELRDQLGGERQNRR